MTFVVRPYEERDEGGWLICRLLAFFDTAFFDAVEREKERYQRPVIELVAESDGRIVGLLDLECESDGLADRPGPGGTRDDLPTQRWYERHGFVQIDSYLHVYLERDDLRAFDDGELRLVKAFAHYTRDRRDEIRARYARVHDDVLYEKRLTR
jgi:hypothetical protein